MAILEVHNIEKHFGSTRVLEDISFTLDQGRIVVQGKTLFDAADPATQRES